MVSVVLAVYNERDSLAPLAGELATALGRLAVASEVIFVDDASTDGSREVLEEVIDAHPGFRVIRHRANCGQSAGHATGFMAARGRIVVTMDADGQNDPADIPMLVEALTDGVDCVLGVRGKRQDSWLKRVCSRAANRFRNALLGERVTDAGCAFRAVRRSCLREVPVFNGMHRFVPTMLRLQGYTTTEVPVHHRPRMAGRTKYGVHDRLWRGLRDCLAMRWYRKRVLPGRRAEPESSAPPVRAEKETSAV